jgi:tetratricopeptide (TPR) repeat protein
MELKNYLGAVEAYSHAVDGYGQHVSRLTDVLYNRGLAYDRLDWVKRARVDYKACLHYSPRDSDALIYVGILELDNGQLGRARKHLEGAAAIDPPANWQLADAYIERGKVEQARTLLQLAIDAGEAWALQDLAYLAEQDGDNAAAKRLLMNAIDLGVPGARTQLTELTEQ